MFSYKTTTFSVEIRVWGFHRSWRFSSRFFSTTPGTEPIALSLNQKLFIICWWIWIWDSSNRDWGVMEKTYRKHTRLSCIFLPSYFLASWRQWIWKGKLINIHFQLSAVNGELLIYPHWTLLSRPHNIIKTILHWTARRLKTMHVAESLLRIYDTII